LPRENSTIIGQTQLAVAGQTQISPKAAAQLVQKVVAAARPEKLSEREAEVLQLLARGSANKQIGRDLGIAEKTVKTHVSNILGKLGVQSRTQAALYAGRVGLVPLDELGEAQHHQPSAATRRVVTTFRLRHAAWSSLT